MGYLVVARIAIIPARGGSKRIPKKNIIDFGGRPMIAWTIDAAIRSGCFERVLVSTDDEEIAEVARANGADVPFLRQKYADDVTPVSLATISAIGQAERYWGLEFDTVVQLMPNCPLRQDVHITEALENFELNNLNYQISCFKYGWMNPWWAVQLDGNHSPAPLFPDALKQRSQDLGPLYCPTGAVWVADRVCLVDSKTFYGPDHRYLPIPWFSALDIDDYDDLKMAEATLPLIGKDKSAQ